jgi:hypothetical protein
VVFRVSQDRSVVPAWIRHRLQHWAKEFSVAASAAAPADGEAPVSLPFVPPSQLPWDPHGRMWYLKASRDAVRKEPALQRFHEFLKEQTETGLIVRQEAVSMLPPLLLGVQPAHHVLDMCAAPGSKTTQLLGDLHAGEQRGGNDLAFKQPT